MASRSILPFIFMMVLTELIAVALYLACLLILHTNPFGIYGNFVISLGGAIFGILGSLGAVPGARMAGLYPTVRHTVMTIAMTLAALTFYHLALYLVLAGGDAKSGGFFAFLDAMHGHVDFRMTSASDNGTDIGSWGYGLLGLDYLWAGIGALLPSQFLRLIPHCESCQTYFRKRKKHSVRYAEENELIDALAGMPTTLQDRAEAMMRLEQWKKVKTKRGTIRVALMRSECPSCHLQSMVEEIQIYNGKGFVRVDRAAYRWSPTPARRIEPQTVAVPAGFGRKGITT